MLKLVPLLLLPILVGVGCQSPPPPAYTYEPYVPEPYVYIIDPTEEPKPAELRFINSTIRDITTNSALLDYETNIPSTAVIRLIEVERELPVYKENNKSTRHSVFLGALNPSKPYTVVIEATGSNTAKRILTFNTNTPVPIYYAPQSYFGYSGGYSYSTSTGSVYGTYISSDGMFLSNVWTVSGYPGEVKTLTLRITNTTGSAQLISFSYTGDDSNVEISGAGLTLNSGQSQDLTIQATIKGYAIPSTYSFDIMIMYGG